MPRPVMSRPANPLRAGMVGDMWYSRQLNARSLSASPAHTRMSASSDVESVVVVVVVVVCTERAELPVED